ncbi:TniQ family protein [[Actinomadura] parvosata]|uniref:TniQ family protein n=1 Tax=[Actinomadura] parvosata TaxID=1955412 RepID=UPI00406CA1F9
MTAHRRTPDRLRRLPRAIAPIQDETVASYFNRLARANHMTPSYLNECLTGERNRYPRGLSEDILVALSGWPAEALRYALPDLRTVDDTATMALAGRSTCGRSVANIRPACRHCMAARGLTNPVYCWVRHD